MLFRFVFVLMAFDVLKLTSSAAVLEVHLQHYSSFKSRSTLDGKCCPEGCHTGCRLIFQVCLFGKQCVTTGTLMENYETRKIEFPGSRDTVAANSIFFKVDKIPKNRSFEIKINVDAKLKADKNSGKKPFARITSKFQVKSFTSKNYSREEAHKATAKKSGFHNSVDFTTRSYCESNYRPPECLEKICVPRDDREGHYDCDAGGRKICMKGWTDPESNCTTAMITTTSMPNTTQETVSPEPSTTEQPTTTQNTTTESKTTTEKATTTKIGRENMTTKPTTSTTKVPSTKEPDETISTTQPNGNGTNHVRGHTSKRQVILYIAVPAFSLLLILIAGCVCLHCYRKGKNSCCCCSDESAKSKEREGRVENALLSLLSDQELGRLLSRRQLLTEEDLQRVMANRQAVESQQQPFGVAQLPQFTYPMWQTPLAEAQVVQQMPLFNAPPAPSGQNPLGMDYNMDGYYPRRIPSPPPPFRSNPSTPPTMRNVQIDFSDTSSNTDRETVLADMAQSDADRSRSSSTMTDTTMIGTSSIRYMPQNLKARRQVPLADLLAGEYKSFMDPRRKSCVAAFGNQQLTVETSFDGRSSPNLHNVSNLPRHSIDVAMLQTLQSEQSDRLSQNKKYLEVPSRSNSRKKASRVNSRRTTKPIAQQKALRKRESIDVTQQNGLGVLDEATARYLNNSRARKSVDGLVDASKSHDTRRISMPACHNEALMVRLKDQQRSNSLGQRSLEMGYSNNSAELY